MLSRLWVLYPPFAEGVRQCTVTDDETIVFEEAAEREEEEVPPFRLMVVDEGHHIYRDPVMRAQVEAYVQPEGRTRRIVLADVSQSLGDAIDYPAPATRVVLSEVVRCSKRIVQVCHLLSLSLSLSLSYWYLFSSFSRAGGVLLPARRRGEADHTVPPREHWPAAQVLPLRPRRAAGWRRRRRRRE
jgi:ribosomal protein L21